jgi:hypothetical protein
MSQIILNGHDINAVLQKFVSPNCCFENGLIKFAWGGGDLTLHETTLTTRAEIDYLGLAVEASEVSLNAAGIKIQFAVKGANALARPRETS